MSLSIIVPCLNEADGIEATLAALSPLRRRGTEVIIVDGGSTDATVHRAREADRIFTAPRGRSVQMNAGAAHASGGILLFLHADCRLPLEADRLVIEGLQRTRGGWGRFDVHIESRSPLLRLVAALMNLRSRMTGIATGDQALFVTRSLFEAVGGDVNRVRSLPPSDPIQCMIAFNYFCAERGHPCSILGMLYSLEVIASAYAATLSQSIAKSIGKDMDGPGFRFLLSHSSMDQDHVAKLNVLVKTIDDPEAQQAIINATRVNFYQFGRMFYEGGFDTLVAD